MSNPTPKLMLSIRQVAETLGVSRRTVWRLVSQGVLPQPVRLSTRIVRWAASEIEAAIIKLQGRRYDFIREDD